MSMVIFHRIRFKNFMMAGDEFTEVVLDAHPTTLIMGKNGTGKSTVLDALTYGLFGEPFRDINVPMLINDTNQCDMMVEVDFSIGKKKYMVRRGLKPRIFEIYIGSKLQNQDGKATDYQKFFEQTILKMNKKTFTQVIVLGSASFVPFMRMTPAERRFIIEDLLDIQIFSSMNEYLKQKVKDMKEEHSVLLNQIEISNEKVALIAAYAKRLKTDTNSAIREKHFTIVENLTQCATWDNEIASLLEEIQSHLDITKTHQPIQTKIKKLEVIEDKLKDSKVKTIKEQKFFQENEICPTCKQTIDHEFKENMVSKKTNRVDEINEAMVKLQGDLATQERQLENVVSVINTVRELEQKITKIQASIDATKQVNLKIKQEQDDLKNNTGDVQEQETKLAALQAEHDSLTNKRDSMASRKHYLDIVAVMLKDSGIKTKIIKQYLPIINKFVNKFIADMEFFATFTLDENFKETIHIRGSKERVYYQLSEGQKLRMDLAVLFTWREITKLKNNANTNLLILDEVIESALDQTGVDDFLKVIQDLSKNINIFIISPKGDPLVDKFSNTVKFIEEHGFSVIEK